MERSKPEESTRVSRRRLVRILSILVGILVLVGAGLLVMNLSAAKANGAANAAEEENGEENGEDKKAPVPVEVAAVVSGPVSAYISASANLVAENQVKVLSELEGRVLQIFVEEGDLAQRGQPLATLVRDDEEIGLKKAQLKETNARLAHERGTDLAVKELISREDYDKLAMDFEIAREELAEARWRLDKTTLRAPFSGKISERMVQPGQHVRPGDEMFQITDFDPLIARIYLPERDILGLEPGRQVRIRLQADESVSFDGRIRQISPIVDTATGTVKVTIEAVEPPAGVRPGSFVSIDIVRETRPDALLLPREAVLRELKSAHVFVATGEVAEKRAVRLGLEEGLVVEVVDGVEPGEQVIVAGQGGLKDGSPVKVMEPRGAEDAEDVG